MTRFPRLAALVALGALVAAPAFAALSEDAKKFIAGPAGYLATDAEKAEFAKLADDAAAVKWEALFWARRDPTPGTFANEFRDDFMKRVNAANHEKFKKDVGGAIGDRGMIFVLFGTPSINSIPLNEYTDKQQGSGASTSRGAASEGTGEPPILGEYRKGTATFWRYSKDKLPPNFPSDSMKFVFITEEGRGENQLERTAEVMKAIDLAKNAAIKSPDMKVVPEWATIPPAPPAAALAEPFAGILAAAFTAEPAGSAEKAKLFSNSARFISGRPFTSLLLVAKKDAVPAAAPPAAGAPAPASPFAPLKYFGEVRSADGTPVARFAVDGGAGMPLETNDEISFGHSVQLSPGEYKVAVGVASADGATVHFVRSATVKVADMNDGEIHASELLLAKGVTTLDKPQAEDQPYCFGGVRVIPAAFTTWKPTDSLWYFFTLAGLSLDPTTKQPLIQTSIIVKEAGSEKARVRTPASDTVATPMGDGRYAVGMEIPLEQVKLTNGTWRFEIDVQDKVAGKRTRVGSEFVITGGKDPEKPADPKGADKKGKTKKK